MKRSLFRSLTSIFLIIAITLFSGSVLAQGNGNGGGNGGGGNGGGGNNGGGDPDPDVNIAYRAFWPNVPAETLYFPDYLDFAFATDAAGNPTVALIVGSYYRSDRVGLSAFVYDHFGLIDPNQPQKFWDILELVGGSFPSWVPATHQISSIRDCNSSGRVVGWTSSVDNDYIGFYIDLTDPNREMKRLPDYNANAVTSWGSRVNENGEVLICGRAIPPGSGGKSEMSIYDPDSDYLVHIRKNANEPMLFPSSHPRGFNNNWDVLTYADEPYIKFRINEDAIDPNGYADAICYFDSATKDVFDQFSKPTRMNEFGQFGATFTEQIRKNKYRRTAVRVGADSSIEWNGGDSNSVAYVDDINNSGDLVFGDLFNFGNEFYFHEGDPLVSGDETFIPNFETLIIPESDPNGYFADSYLSRSVQVSDRDVTGFGWIVGEIEAGLNSDGSIKSTLVLLIPEELP